jgi:hypothetical protein
LTTLSDGYLGSVIDEGRSKVRQVSRLADSRELTNFSMHIADRLFAQSAMCCRVYRLEYGFRIEVQKLEAEVEVYRRQLKLNRSRVEGQKLRLK